METVYDVLYYLNKLNFTGKVDTDDFENVRCVNRFLVKEFEDYVFKLSDILGIIDSFLNTLKAGELQDILNKAHILKK